MPKKFSMTLFSGHALPDAFIFEHLLIDFHLILPALVRRQDQPAVVRDFLESVCEHFSNLVKVRTSGQGTARNFTLDTLLPH